MAEPTIDSNTSLLGKGTPTSGVGSKTPPTPGLGLGMGTPQGGTPTIKPKGEPGRPSTEKTDLPPAPKSPEEIAQDTLTARSKDTFVDDLSQVLEESEDLIPDNKGMLPEEKINLLVDALLERGWTENALKRLINKSGLKPKEFFKTVAKLIKKSGEQAAIDFLNKKLNPAPPEGSAMQTPGGPPSPGGAPSPLGGGGAPPSPVGGGGTPPIGGGGAPPMGMPPMKEGITDVDLETRNYNKREGHMTRVIVTKEGTLEQVSDKNKNEVLEKLVLAIRNTKSAVKKMEDEKLRYAGILALKTAAEFEDFDEDADEDSDIELDEEIDIEEESDDADVDKSKILDGIEKVQEGIGDIEDAVKGVEGDMESDDMSADEFSMADNLMTTAAKTIEKAREVVKTAKKDIEALEKKSKGKGKGKGKAKDSQKAMDVTMGKKGGFKPFEKKDKKDEKDEKDEKKEDKDKDNEDKKSSETDELIKRVKARLAQLREDKEANLYPFKELQGPVEKVDNINETSAKQQSTTINSEITSQPVQDKDYPTINPEMAQKDLPYKQEGSNVEGKKVSSDTDANNRIRNAIDKARLSVELAATQQLKDLVDNPLKIAFVKNMVEAGIDETVANTIAHNAFIDGYEESQKIIMKEAFETFMAKPYKDFVKVAKFTTEYVPKEEVLSSVEDEDAREKTASSAPLRGTKADHQNDEYKRYWQDVERNRRGF